MSLEYKVLGQITVDSFNEIVEPIGFVAVASAFFEGTDTAAYSTNGIAWTQTTMPQNSRWFSIAHGNNKFVAIAGFSTTAAYSTNGITWTQTTLPDSQIWTAVTYGDDKFVAVARYFGDNTAAYSTDGIAWTGTTLPGTSINSRSVTYGNGRFVALGFGTSVAYSTNGIAWQLATLPADSDWRIAYGNDVFLALSGAIAVVSTDAITWTGGTVLPSNQSWTPAYGSDKFVAVARYTDIAAYSTDGTTWSQTTLPANAQWRSVAYGDGEFVSLAYNSNTAAHSTDGITWTQTTLPANTSWISVSYGEDREAEYVPKTIYTVPENKEAITSSIFISNTSETSDTYNFAVVPNGQTLSDIHNIRKNVAINGKDFHQIETKITLSAGDSLVALSAAVNKLNITVFGVEK